MYNIAENVLNIFRKVIWVMDHCTPNPEDPMVARYRPIKVEEPEDVPVSLIVTGPSGASGRYSKGECKRGSVVTHFFCRLLRGVCVCNGTGKFQTTREFCICVKHHYDDAKAVFSAKDFARYRECVKWKITDVHDFTNRHVKPDNVDEANVTLAYYNPSKISYLIPRYPAGKSTIKHNQSVFTIILFQANEYSKEYKL